MYFNQHQYSPQQQQSSYRGTSYGNNGRKNNYQGGGSPQRSPNLGKQQSSPYYYQQQQNYQRQQMVNYGYGYSNDDYYSNTRQSNSGDWCQLPSVDTPDDNRVVVTDNYDECIWTGSSNGRITGYYYPNMEKYCSFRAFEPNYDVKQLIVQKERIYSLCSNGFAVHTRGGLYRYSYEDSKLFGEQLLSCAFNSDHTPGSSSSGSRSQYSLIMGGNFTKLFSFDLNAQKMGLQVETNQGICVMKTGGRYVCCGGTLGELSLRDPRTLKSEHSFEVHTGTINDIAIKDNVLVTCGFNNRYGELSVDNMVKAYDLRTLRMLGQVHFQLDPTFLGFHPRVNSVLMIVSQTGYFQFKDLQASFDHRYQNSDGSLYQIFDQDNSNCIQSFDISTTGNVLTFADTSNTLHFYSTQNQSSFDDDFKPLNLHKLVDDEEVTNDGSSLLSDWPNYSYMVGQHPLEIHPQILENLQYKNPPNSKISYGTSINPGLKRVIDGYLERRTFKDFAQENTKSKKKLSRVLRVIPKEFSLNVAKHNNRLRFQEFDYSKYNDTKFVGLENGLEIASIFNAYVQVLYHIVPQLKVCLMNHLSDKTNCIASELGFLFTMIEQAEKTEKKAVEATNLYRAIQNLELTFLNEKSSKISCIETIQKFHSYIIKQLHKEFLATTTFSYSMTYPYIFASPNYNFLRSTPNNKKQVIATNNSNIQLLKKQNKRRQRTMVDILFGSEVQTQKTVDTNFDNKLKSVNPQYPYDNFEVMLKDYLNNGSGSLLTLPNIFNFTVPAREEDIRWIRTQHTVNELTNTTIPLHFTIIHGTDKNQWEPFIYNNEKQRQLQEAIHGIQPAEVYTKQKRKPPMSITYNLAAVIIQVKHPFQEKSTAPKTPTTKIIESANKEDYENIENENENEEDECEEENENISLSKNFDGHCVALIKIANEWVLFNDFSISPQKEKDVTIYSQTWKSPALLFYVRQDIQNVLPTVNPVNPISENTSLFNNDEFKTIVNFNGDIVSIDAEFVRTRKEDQIDDGQRFGLGRVSIITFNEEILIDDYISTAEKRIGDYMTRFSGLKAGDLDINNKSNTHYVTDIKNTYLKLRYLLDVKKVKFIGHGLPNDFKIINIFVPKEQIIDTVELYRLPNQRKISLRFLCKYLLNQDIQQDTHDSIEDARTALRLYKKYLELKQKNTFTSTLQDIYTLGRNTNWV